MILLHFCAFFHEHMFESRDLDTIYVGMSIKLRLEVSRREQICDRVYRHAFHSAFGSSMFLEGKSVESPISAPCILYFRVIPPFFLHQWTKT